MCQVEKIGAAYYTSPEMIKDGEYDEKADVYSIGMIFYLMLSNMESPFESREDWLILHQIKTIGVKIDKRDFENIDVSPESLDLLKKMLEMRPRFRPSAEQCLNHIWF